MTRHDNGFLCYTSSFMSLNALLWYKCISGAFDIRNHCETPSRRPLPPTSARDGRILNYVSSSASQLHRVIQQRLVFCSLFAMPAMISALRSPPTCVSKALGFPPSSPEAITQSLCSRTCLTHHRAVWVSAHLGVALTWCGPRRPRCGPQPCELIPGLEQETVVQTLWFSVRSIKCSFSSPLAPSTWSHGAKTSNYVKMTAFT